MTDSATLENDMTAQQFTAEHAEKYGDGGAPRPPRHKPNAEASGMAPTDREFDMLVRELARIREQQESEFARLHLRQDKQGEALDSIMETLAAAKGGMSVWRFIAAFFGVGTLGGILALFAQISGWRH